MTTQEAAYEALKRASGGEWIDAGTVLRQMATMGLPAGVVAPKSPAAMGRVLAQLAEAGYCRRADHEGASRWRVEMRAVVVYDGTGQEVGRLLMVEHPRGLILDLGQLHELLPLRDWRLVLEDRDIRTMRAACDDALLTTSGWRR